MAIASSLSLQGFSSGGAAQAEQRQAQRRADQAESQARALQSQARDAQSVANQAQQDARSLNIQAGQAQGDAFNARQGVAAIKLSRDSEVQLSSALKNASAKLSPTPPVVDASAKQGAAVETNVSALTPVVNAFGQQTGTVLSVTA